MKPAMQVVLLQHQTHLLTASGLNSADTNLDDEDELEIDDTPV
jgi:hypothetical protein